MNIYAGATVAENLAAENICRSISNAFLNSDT